MITPKATPAQKPVDAPVINYETDERDLGEPQPISPVKFSGTALSVECFLQGGQFNNFKIVTLRIDNGIVVDRTVSDPYASFEAIAHMEILVNKALLSLNFNYADGKAWNS